MVQGGKQTSAISKSPCTLGLEGQKECHLIPGARVSRVSQDHEDGRGGVVGFPRKQSPWRLACRGGWMGGALGRKEQDGVKRKAGLETFYRKASQSLDGRCEAGWPSELAEVGARKPDLYNPTIPSHLDLLGSKCDHAQGNSVKTVSKPNQNKKLPKGHPAVAGTESFSSGGESGSPWQ